MWTERLYTGHLLILCPSLLLIQLNSIYDLVLVSFKARWGIRDIEI
jgi:hypothetical protein